MRVLLLHINPWQRHIFPALSSCLNCKMWILKSIFRILKLLEMVSHFRFSASIKNFDITSVHIHNKFSSIPRSKNNFSFNVKKIQCVKFESNHKENHYNTLVSILDFQTTKSLYWLASKIKSRNSFPVLLPKCERWSYNKFLQGQCVKALTLIRLLA